MVSKEKNRCWQIGESLKRATKLILELSNKLYRELLKILHLPTPKYRRYRGDMIELFKIIKGVYDSTCVPHVDFVELLKDLIRTRGNNFKLIQQSTSLSLWFKEIQLY